MRAKRTDANKYHAVRCEVDGYQFASKKEARRYVELRLLERAGEIADLVCQPVYALQTLTTPQAGVTLGQMKRERGAKAKLQLFPTIGRYIADFRYTDKRTGDVVIEDVKGFKTELYKWKKRHVEAQYGIQIVEI